jgi:hypothetical protein
MSTGRPTALTPVKLTIYWVDPEADPSVFENVLVRPDGAFLVVNPVDAKPRVAHMFPAHRIDTLTAEEWLGQ